MPRPGSQSARRNSPGVPLVLGVQRLDLLVGQDLVHGLPLLPVVPLPAQRHVAGEQPDHVVHEKASVYEMVLLSAKKRRFSKTSTAILSRFSSRSRTQTVSKIQMVRNRSTEGIDVTVEIIETLDWEAHSVLYGTPIDLVDSRHDPALLGWSGYAHAIET